MVLQVLTKTEDKEIVNPMAKSSLEPTSDEHLMKTRLTDGRHQVSHAGPRYCQPMQQRFDTTVATSASMLTNHLLILCTVYHLKCLCSALKLLAGRILPLL